MGKKLLEPFFNKHAFSREYSEIFKNTYFKKHLRTPAFKGGEPFFSSL